MVERTEFESVNNGDELKEGYYNGILTDVNVGYTDSDTSSASSSNMLETEIGEVTIPANTIETGVFVIAQIRWDQAGIVGHDIGTFRLRIGSSGTATSNTLVNTCILRGHNATNVLIGGVLIGYYTGATWSSTNYAHVTVATSGGSGETGYCDYITVLKIK